jgi:hypothetical protein
VLLDRLDEDLGSRHANAPQAVHQRCAPLGRDPARSPVSDAAIGVERAEVPAGRDVAGPELEIDAQVMPGAT